jgi:hypothetical protein
MASIINKKCIAKFVTVEHFINPLLLQNFETPLEIQYAHFNDLYAALGQVFSEYLGFPCQSFHQFLHHHNHPGLAQ